MARDPSEFELFNSGRPGGIRILDLGAGTGLLSILCRKLLDLHSASISTSGPIDDREARGTEVGAGPGPGLVVATDFLPEVLDNLKICVDLNFPTPLAGPASTPSSESRGQENESGIHIAKLDWTTFPTYMQRRLRPSSPSTSKTEADILDDDGEETSRFMDEPFDLVLASDCVYDPTHAELLRKVASWVLRLPDPEKGDKGGTFVSPLCSSLTPSRWLLTCLFEFPLLLCAMTNDPVAYPLSYSTDIYTRARIYRC